MHEKIPFGILNRASMSIGLGRLSHRKVFFFYFGESLYARRNAKKKNMWHNVEWLESVRMDARTSRASPTLKSLARILTVEVLRFTLAAAMHVMVR